jgi:hypothetical protein
VRVPLPLPDGEAEATEYLADVVQRFRRVSS